uniref:Ig-like domain-containing protein n=1 Tax=Meleagris gallopavo TaxID=9103 RepID=G5E7H4_MELGA
MQNSITILSLADGFAQEIPIQSPISITRFQKSARMFCEMKKLPGRFDNTVIHWYQLKENKPPERLLFFAGGKTTVESGFQGNKYMVDKVSSRNLCILTINNVSPDDAATYYCAYWDPHLDRCSETIKGCLDVFRMMLLPTIVPTGMLTVAAQQSPQPKLLQQLNHKPFERSLLTSPAWRSLLNTWGGFPHY